MTQEALKLALDALIWTTGSGDFGEGGYAHEGAKKCLFPAIAAIKEALAQPEQEPWCMKMNGCTAKCEDCPDKPPPTPQRTWVDLTRTQIQDVYFAVLEEHRGGHQMQGQLAFGEALQAKIKERNT